MGIEYTDVLWGRLMGIEYTDLLWSRLMGIEDADNEETACIIANLIYESKIKVKV